jgi:putative transposase
VPKAKGSSGQVNVIGTLGFYEGQPTLDDQLFEGVCTSEVVAAYLETVAARSHPEVWTVVVLDNASFHRSAFVQAQLRRWEEQGLYLFFLPPYASELNLIERVWWALKYSLQPRRSYGTVQELRAGMVEALQALERQWQLEEAIAA